MDAIDLMKVSEATRRCDMVQKTGTAVGLVRIN